MVTLVATVQTQICAPLSQTSFYNVKKKHLSMTTKKIGAKSHWVFGLWEWFCGTVLTKH